MPTGIRKVAFPKECRSIEVEEWPRYTHVHEVQALCWLAREVPGDILEMGCNDGRTTRELAMNFPDRRILAVDFAAKRDTLCPEQKGEKPPPEHIARYARGFPNVEIYNRNSQRLDLTRKPFSNARLLFIDGDHSYEGVKADTIIALAHLKRHRAGMIVWHDFQDDAPEWMKVYEYVTREIAPHYYVEWIDTTRLAVLRWSALSAERANPARASGGGSLWRNGIRRPRR